MPRDLTTKEAAQALNFTPRRITQLIDKGELEGHKIGRRWYVRADEVKRFRKEAHPNLGPDSAQRLFIVSSGHKDALCKSAREIIKQMDVPICQLARLSILKPENPALSIDVESGRPSVHLECEKTEMFRALKEHMRDSKMWSILDSWKTETANLVISLRTLSDYVRNQATVKSVGFATLDDIPRGGLLAPFPSTVAVNAVEDSNYRKLLEQPFEVSADKNGRILIWNRGGTSYAIAAGNEKELNDIEGLHTTLRRNLGQGEETRQIAEGFKKLYDFEYQLRKDVGHLANLATIPGICDLCKL